MSTMKQKIAYRRTESEPANATVNHIRSRFESTTDTSGPPDVGLSFIHKRSTLSLPVSPVSPLIQRKPIKETTKSVETKSSSPATNAAPLLKKTIKQTSDTPLDKLLNKSNKILSTQLRLDKDKKAVKPNSLIIPNGDRTKHVSADKPALISLHNTGIVSTCKQRLTSPIVSPTVTVPSSKAPKLKLESPATNKAVFSDRIRSSKEHTDSITTTSNSESKDKASQLSLPEGKTQEKQPAKTFWKSLSHDSDGSHRGSPSKLDSIFEPGTDYAKLKKDAMSTSKPATDKPKASPKTSKTTQLTASNLNKASETLTESKIQSWNSQITEELKSSRNSLSKSPSVSSTCSSMDSSDIDYMNGSFSHKLRRRDTKPPQNIVARRTQLFEKSLDEINSVSEEAEAYNRVKEGGFGTVFKPKDPTLETPSSPQGKPKITCVPLINAQSVSKSKTLQPNSLPKDKSASLNNNNAKTPDKNLAEFRPIKSEEGVIENHKNVLAEMINSLKPASKAKPLPLLPSESKSADRNSSSLKPPPPPTALKPKVKGAPPKPPRTFEHPVLTPSSSNEISFDPVVIPRQAGDGEENHDYERHVSCQSPHVYTSVTLCADARPYTTTTSIDTRPYTSLTTTGGSGGDDSVAGSENAYDTLGKASVASSYEHYDTISQSELDSDISRPPTLPRRPSNLRHRPLTTPFSHLDISKNNTAFQNQLSKALTSTAQTIKETSPTSPSPTKIRVPFKLKYLLPRARRKADEIRKASSMADLLDEKESLYDSVDIRPSLESARSSQTLQSPPEVPIDEAGYALPDIKGSKWHGEVPTPNQNLTRPGEPHQAVKSQTDKATEKIRLKLNQAFSALRKPVTTVPTQVSDGEDEERPPDPEVLEEMLKHCTSVKEHAIYASVEQIKGFMTRVYAQLYDYAVIVGLRKNPESSLYEPYVKYKFPPQVDVEQTTVPQFCYPDAHIWHKCTEYKSEAFSFVLTDVTGTRQYGYCRRVLPPDLNNLPRTAEVICVVSPLNATKLYNQVLDEVEKRRMQNSGRAEEFLQAVYGRPLPSPGQSVNIRAMNVREEPECLVFTRSPDSQREGIDYECILNMLSVSQIIKVFASILLERKIIFIAEKLSILSSCVHAFAALIYPFSWQHTFIPLLPPNLIDIVGAPTPYIVGLLSSNSHLLNSLDEELEEVLIVDLDNHKFLQRMGDEKLILPKKLHRALVTALDMAKSESQGHRSAMVAEAFLRFFLETTGAFNHFMIHVPGAGRQFQKEEFVCNASNAPSIMVFLQWFTETQMFEVYTTERENDRNVISGTFEERVFEFQSEDHEELFNDNKRFKKFKLFGKNKKR